MSENIEKAFDSLSEQAKKLDISLYFTRGDQEKAKEMVAGTYKDLFAIKGKFTASSIYGAFLFFFSAPYASLIDSYLVISHSYEVDDIKTTAPWRDFEAFIEDIVMKGEVDQLLSHKLKEDLTSSFTLQMSPDQRSVQLKKLLEMDDEIALNRFMSKFLKDKMEYQISEVRVDYETTSSLDVQLYSISSQKVTDEEINKLKGDLDGDNKTDDDAGEDDESELEGKDVKLILGGDVILAPIKGKAISKVAVGDKIMVALHPSNPRASVVARAFKCYDEGEKTILPMLSRVVVMRHLVEGGYKIFGVLAKGIYAKILEEEENIKIAIETIDENDDASNKNANEGLARKLQIVLTMVIVLIIIVGALLILFL